MQHGDSAPLTVEIQLELSAHALPLQDERHDITSRTLTNSSIVWNVPAQDQHAVVRTPNIMPLLTMLKDLDGWGEQSAVNVMLTPTRGSGKRVFKARDSRMGANLHLLHDIVQLCCAIIGVLIMQFMRSHGQARHAKRLVDAIMSLEGAKSGSPVDCEYADSKSKKLETTEAELKKAGKSSDQISAFIVGELTGDTRKKMAAKHRWHHAKSKTRTLRNVQKTLSADNEDPGKSAAPEDPFAKYRSDTKGEGGFWVSDSGEPESTLRGALELCEVAGPQGLMRRAETMLPDTAAVRETKEELVDDLVACYSEDNWSGDRKSQALFFAALASGTLLPPPGEGNSWPPSRWLVIGSFLAMAVLNAVVQSIKFGRESVLEYELDLLSSAFVDATLAVAGIFQGQLMVLWIAMFTLTCSISASAIEHAIKTLKDTLHEVEAGDIEGIAIWRQHVLDTVYRIDKVSLMLNNDWETIQLLTLAVFSFFLCENLVEIAIQDKVYREFGDYVGVPLDIAACLATLYPAAMVTHATDQVKFELHRINEVYQHKHPTLCGEIASIISHVQCKRMGYRLFDTVEISYATINTLLMYGAPIVGAIMEARSL